MYTKENVKIGDTVHFKVIIAMRTHRSKSKVYGITEFGPLVTCNGFYKTFQVRWREITKCVA
jgi:hypothetical protein